MDELVLRRVRFQQCLGRTLPLLPRGKSIAGGQVDELLLNRVAGEQVD